nr:ribonuclease H-like domain-containing protein [Tanacetum cinerariifolium]
MMPAQSNVTPTGLPSQPTSITIQPRNVGLTALSGQATTIPHAFTTKTLQDFFNGAWNMDTDGTLSRYKARLVANGSTQLEGIDVDETFSPVVKPGTIWTVLDLDVSRHSPIHQLDVKNAFLYGDLSETVYMHQPPSFRDSKYPDHEFFMTDLGSLNYFLGTFVTRDSSEMFLSRKKYAVEIIEKVQMVNCNSSRTPADSESKLGDDGDLISDPTLYQSLACSL